MNFYQKFVRLCNERHVSPSAAILEIGLKKSAVTRWKKGGNPTDATVAKVCEFFHVDLNYFEDEETPADEGERVYSPALQAIIDELYGMTDEQLDKLLLLIQSAKKVL